LLGCPVKPSGVAFDQGEGVVKAQNAPAVFFHRVIARVVEDRSSETLTVNHFAADRSANHRYSHQLRP
jgi:hypothetical protein